MSSTMSNGFAPEISENSGVDTFIDASNGFISSALDSPAQDSSTAGTFLFYPDIDEFDETDEDNELKPPPVSMMDTRRSLTGLAQFMLPALIESENVTEAQRPEYRHRALLGRAHQQIRKGAAGFRDIAERAQEVGRRQVEHFKKQPPLCFIFMNRAYHRYGLKHIVLILVFLAYTAFGAFIFLVAEGPYQNSLKERWSERIAQNRSRRVQELMSRAFNNSEYLVYIKGNTSERLQKLFNDEFESYEHQLGIRWSEQRMEWDFWTALLFAGTVCTTIGYGHIYPVTNAGKILTMIFALFGIPLVLLVLQDIGKLLTITMKFPWFQTKRITRRILRCCTKQSLREMQEIEACERRDLEIFDLPIVVGVSLIFGWVLLCSMVLSVWDQKWSLLESFYFFFISLSTVGLGDLVPSSPRLLVTMFGFILIGLSLVSMVINLLQTKMKKTYEAGRVTHDGSIIDNALVISSSTEKLKNSPTREEPQSISERSLSRSTQTNLSLPGVRQVVLRSDGVHWVTDELPLKSPDEVTHLLEHETALRVCEQIGDNNEDDDNNTDSLGETDALLEKEEDYP
ncbi:unnamed protein product [Cylicocyclus nassatus]|uniref:Potassium channel domain-containing protein n=1 Tax=Cylicocyclus nassatus TaxID=53992 RepID=A0AA36DPF9_CYLNA|nr:unnamed protein product [Cylicocyclus nassatus]